MGFLNEHEAAMLRENISSRHGLVYYGGYPSAERVMLGAGAGEEDFPIVALEFVYKPEYQLSHRDFLGALMALGIRRETVGDILTGTGRTVAFVTAEIAPFILDNVDKIGRVGVRVAQTDTDDLPEGDKGEERTLTLSSLRLDAFTAAVCGLSRDKASKLIKADLVTVDHVIQNDVALRLGEGSVVTVRRYGKYKLSALLGSTKKDRLRIAVIHYG